MTWVTLRAQEAYSLSKVKLRGQGPLLLIGQLFADMQVQRSDGCGQKRYSPQNLWMILHITAVTYRNNHKLFRLTTQR